MNVSQLSTFHPAELCPNGVGNTAMTLDYFGKRLQCRGSARNINTIATLIELATA